MSVFDNYKCEGQMSIFDCFGPDIWSGKTSPEPSVATKAKTSGLSSKKQRGSQIKMPLYLDLRKESGVQAEPSWEMGGVLLGVYTMHSFGECPSVEKESRLSQILEEHPHQRYCLSPKACAGILRRASNRGKELPEILRKTLEQQASLSKLGGGRDVDSNGKKAGKGALIQTELSATLGVSQDQTLITNLRGGQNGTVDHAVLSIGNGQLHDAMSPSINVCKTLNCMDDPMKIVTYGLDRASFNQGQNAQYNFSVEEEKAQTIVAKGPGAVITQEAGE